jgi:hypothetical protein
MQAKYTGIRAGRPIVPHVVKKDLVPALSRADLVLVKPTSVC